MKIALVAGATRGAGRGIATALGEAGFTVYCTGRSVRGQLASGDKRPETIEETAELVTARGGRGIAVQCDHTKREQVEALCARIKDEHGQLDLLVNDVWGGDAYIKWGEKFVDSKLDDGLMLIDRAIQSHIITSYFAIPLLREGSLIVEITDGDGYYYRGHFWYDLVKTTIIRLAFLWAQETKGRGITSVAVTPGFLRSEAMLEHFGVTEANWRDAVEKEAPFIASETPLFVGRAIAALANDPNVATRNGRVFASWDLGDEYGFVDADGSRPHFKRWMEANMPQFAWKKCDDVFYSYCSTALAEYVETMG
ncbi:MAG TPA: SDR family oxidoreductase [Thermoanaerobaculia bacterium]|nr:SDR family oxidoreductase [Thermoanaerobaculia bacterium]